MVWDQLGVSTPHVAYATTGFALILFGTLSLFIKEKLYIGEANVATIYGLIVGPHCLNWFTPTDWGNTDYITLELSRIVLVVQIFAVAVELPKKYMLKHWLSVLLLLVPVMTFGWMLSSVFIWKLVPTLRWIEALCIAACVTATDPVLASAVVGKGKFAKRVPGHLRNILSAESGCNDGMAFPFVYLALNVMKYEHDAKDIAKHFICISILYECVLGCLIGVVIGYCGRHLIKFAEKKNLIDRESFLVYYFCLALFCAGVGTMTGTDDLLVAFAAGAAFSWDGWFAHKTEETHVSNVIDLLINTAYFIYFGSIVPWPQFNNPEIGLKAWKLVIIAILILLFRRIPIVLALKPLIPDIKTWREALFSGHFGPIGVGGLFVAILARAELEEHGTIPLKELPPPGHPHYYAIATIWPITCFLVISSILVHGSSIAVFFLGKRLNNIAFTMTYTNTKTKGAGPSWIRRLQNADGTALKLERIGTRYSEKAPKKGKKGKKVSRKKKGERRDPNKIPATLEVDLRNGKTISHTEMIDAAKLNGKSPQDLNVYHEGKHIVIEDDDGNFVEKVDIGHRQEGEVEGIKISEHDNVNSSHDPSSTELSDGAVSDDDETATTLRPVPGQHLNAYQIDNDVVVENEDGEIVKRYRIVRDKSVEPSASPESHKAPSSGPMSWFRRLSMASPEETTGVKANQTLVPVDKHGHRVQDPEKMDERDTTIRRTVETALNENSLADRTQAMDHAAHARKRPASPPPRSPGSVSDDDDEDDDEEDFSDAASNVSNEEIPFQGDDEDDDYVETEVERTRRLAALGITHDDDEDGEDAVSDGLDLHSPPPTHRRINTIPEEEEKDDEQRIQFHLPEKPR